MKKGAYLSISLVYHFARSRLWISLDRFDQRQEQEYQEEYRVVESLDRFDQRQDSLGLWPTTKVRYCTSDLKRTPCDTSLRNSNFVISLEGVHAQESEARAEKEPFTRRSTITGKRYSAPFSVDQAWSLYLEDRNKILRYQQLRLFDEVVPPVSAQLTGLSRLAFTWYPLFYWTVDNVWEACGTSWAELLERCQFYQEGMQRQDSALCEQALAGWPAHPASVLGSNRLSCSLCFMSDWSSLRAGAIHHPDYYRALCWREIQSGYSFQQNIWLCDVAPELLTDEMRFLLEQHPRRQQWVDTQKQQQVKSAKRTKKSLPVIMG